MEESKQEIITQSRVLILEQEYMQQGHKVLMCCYLMIKCLPPQKVELKTSCRLQCDYEIGNQNKTLVAIIL